MLEYLYCYLVVSGRALTYVGQQKFECPTVAKWTYILSGVVSLLATWAGALVFKWVFNHSFHYLGLPAIHLPQAYLLYAFTLTFIPLPTKSGGG